MVLVNCRRWGDKGTPMLFELALGWFPGFWPPQGKQSSSSYRYWLLLGRRQTLGSNSQRVKFGSTTLSPPLGKSLPYWHNFQIGKIRGWRGCMRRIGLRFTLLGPWGLLRTSRLSFSDLNCEPVKIIEYRGEGYLVSIKEEKKHWDELSGWKGVQAMFFTFYWLEKHREAAMFFFFFFLTWVEETFL